MSPLLFAALCAPHADAIPLDRSVDHALLVQVPPAGLRHLGDAIERVIPPAFPVLDSTGSFACSDGQALDYHLSPFDVRLSTDDVVLTTSAGHLDATLYATLDSTATTLTATGSCAILDNLDEVCDLQLPITAVEVGLSIDLATTPDGVITATVPPLDVRISPIGNPLGDCTLAAAVGTVLGQNPTLIDDLVSDALVPALVDVPAQVETAIEDALNSFSFATTVDVGTPVDLALTPTRLAFTDEGLVVGLAADIHADVPPSCVDPTSLPDTLTSWPPLGDTAPGTAFHHDAGVLIGRAFVQELLNTMWGAGLLCQDLSEFSGARLTGGVVDPFFGGHVSELIGADSPARISVHSSRPPEVIFYEDQPVVAIDLGPLKLDLIADLDHRMTRLAEVGIRAEAGLDLTLDEHVLQPTLAIQPDAFDFDETWSDLLPPGYAGGLGNMLDIVLGGLIPTGSLADVTIPTPLGIDLAPPVWLPTDDGDWLGMYTALDLSGVQPLQVSGCSADALGCGGGGGGIQFDLNQALGCDQATGCDGGSGCVTGGTLMIPTRPLLAFAFLGPLVWLRRRRR